MYKIKLAEVPEEWGGAKLFIKNENEAIESGIFRCDPGLSLPLHTHDEGDEYCYLFQGQGIFVINDEEIEVQTGELIKIPKGVIHRSYNVSDQPFISFYLVCP